jgi:predicted nucleotidyltransferase
LTGFTRLIKCNVFTQKERLPMSKLTDIQQQIAARLGTSPKPFKVILFGSYAYGNPHDDSDIDLLVILDKKGKSDSYKSMINNRVEISKRLRELRRKYPMDILVYTKDEWEVLKASESSFIEKIEREGVAVI